MNEKFKKRMNIGLTLAVLLAMLVTAVVLADNLIVDGDGLVPVSSNTTLNLGSICKEENKSGTVLLAINRLGSGQNTYADGATVTITAGSMSSGITNSFVDNEIALQANWTDLGNNTLSSDTAEATVTVTAGATPGSGTGQVPYNATGNKDGGGSLTRSATLTVNWTVVDCAPADTTAPEIDYVLDPAVPDGDNGWYTSDVTVSWTVVDEESDVTSSTGCDETTIDYDTAGVTLTCSATSAGGTASESVTIKRDATPPVTTDNAPSGWQISDFTVTFTASDNLSGVAKTFYQVGVEAPVEGDNVTFDTEGVFQLSFWSEDNAGNVETANPVEVKLDKTGPTAVLSATGTAGANGWFVGDVTISTSGTDDISSPVTCTVDQYQTGETAGTVFYGSCTNAAGLTTHAEPLTIKLDKTGPTAVLSATGTAGANEWFVGDVTISTAGSDDISSPVTCTVDQYQTGETAGTVFYGSCTNAAGLTTHAEPLTIKLDKTGPTAVLSATGTAGANEWFVGDVTISTAGTDDISSPVTCTVDQHQTSETTGTIFNGSCTNDAGLTTNATPLTVKLDKTGPTAALSATGTAGANEWFVGDVTISTAGSDDISSPVTCTVDQHQTSETTGTIFNGSCTNDAGLTTNATPLTVKLDKTGPTAALSATGTAGANGWFIGNVTISTSGTDDISSPVTCTADQYQTTDTPGTEFNGSCTNDAGLTTNATPLTVKLDKTPPTLNWSNGPADGASYYFSFVPAAPTCTAADDTSGPNGCSVTGHGTTVGTHTMTAKAYDAAGNSYSEQRTYTVLAWTPTGFYRPVDMNGVWNTVKGGSTVPLKFNVYAGSTELTSTSVVSAYYKMVTCNGGPEDTVELVATGGTSLRYSDSQFIYNWQTPKLPGKCYMVTVETMDGSTIVANFKLK
jgi:hypothetical protein